MFQCLAGDDIAPASVRRRAPKTQHPSDRQGDVMPEAPPPHSIILLKRTLLRALMNRLQIVNELIIERYRGLNRKVIRLFEADGLQ